MVQEIVADILKVDSLIRSCKDFIATCKDSYNAALDSNYYRDDYCSTISMKELASFYDPFSNVFLKTLRKWLEVYDSIYK